MGALRAGYQVTPDLRLARRLGGGGMGSVWVGFHTRLDTEVIVKFLSPSMTGDEASRKRFAREVALSARVRSAHVVQMLDHGITEDGMPYLVMEHLDGEDLDHLLQRRGKLEPAEVLHIVEGAAAALQLTHERGIVHRDVKPANLFLCNDGGGLPFVKLVDFGIAKRMEDGLTQSGETVGTPKYMSPEQCEGRTVDFRSDLWGLGVLTYHMLAGSPPFDGATFADVALAIMRDSVKPLSTVRRDLPPEIDRFMTMALARDPAQRFGSARALSISLAEALGRTPASRGLPPTSRVQPGAPATMSLMPDIVGSTFRAAVTTPKPRASRFSFVASVALGVAMIMMMGDLGYRAWQRMARPARKATKAVAAATAPPAPRASASVAPPLVPPPPLVAPDAAAEKAGDVSDAGAPNANTEAKNESTTAAKSPVRKAGPAPAPRPSKPARPRAPRSGEDDIGF